MPNHVLTSIKADRKAIKDLITLAWSIDEWTMKFDFNKIIKTPDHIYQWNLWQAEREKYGEENCWYHWNISNWGTKRNAYFVEFKEDEIKFETARSHPDPIIEEISRLFPEVEFEISYADEDIGNNCDQYTIKNTEKVTIGITKDVKLWAMMFRWWSEEDINEYYAEIEEDNDI